MGHKPEDMQPENASRREVLRRLVGASVAAYVVPEVVLVSSARAGTSSPSSPVPSAPVPSTPDEVDTPVPSSPPEEAPVPDSEEETQIRSHEDARERCNTSPASDQGGISISRSDLRRSQDAIEAGYAKPLEQIWGTFTASYDGRVIGVEFIGRRKAPRYRFRAISASGRLETVTISAQTGAIEKIVGCG